MTLDTDLSGYMLDENCELVLNVEAEDKLHDYRAKVQKIAESYEASTVKVRLPYLASDVVNAVAHYYEMDPAEMRQPQKRHDFRIEAKRVAAMVLCDLGFSYSRIANVLGASDHSSATYLINTFEEHAGKNPIMKRVRAAFTEALQK